MTITMIISVPTRACASDLDWFLFSYFISAPMLVEALSPSCGCWIATCREKRQRIRKWLQWECTGYVLLFCFIDIYKYHCKQWWVILELLVELSPDKKLTCVSTPSTLLDKKLYCWLLVLNILLNQITYMELEVFMLVSKMIK